MAGWSTGPLGEQRFPIGRALQAGVCAGAGGLRAHLEEKEVTARRAEVHEAATRGRRPSCRDGLQAVISCQMLRR